MTINELGKICDYLYESIKPQFPNEYPEDVYGIIYKNMKRNNIKERNYLDVVNEMKHFEYSHYSVVDFKRNKVIGVRDEYKKAMEFKKELEQDDNFYKGRLKIIPTIPGKLQRGDKLQKKFITKELNEDFIFNVKPRRHATEPTPIVTALGIGRRIHKEIY